MVSDPGGQRDSFRWTILALINVSVGTALLLVAQMSILTYIPLYLKESMGFSAYHASQALALAGIILLATLGLIFFVKEPRDGYKNEG